MPVSGVTLVLKSQREKKQETQLFGESQEGKVQ